MNTLLPTKFYLPPAPVGFVARPRLFERLDEALSHRLTLVSAQAGAGKTTLVGAWAQAARKKGAVAFGWLSLDEADNAPGRFWECLAACLEEGGVGIDPGGVLPGNSEAGDGADVPAGLVRGLMALKGELILILDDYHLIQNKEIHTALGKLLDHTPPRLHLVLLTRSDPPLELARMRVSGHLAEIRMEHLRFSVDEAAALLKKSAAVQLSDAEVSALNTRAEGWAAGLRMAAISLRGHEDAANFVSAFAGSHRFVFDYLLEQVLNRQKPEVRDFLLQTSVLGRLCAPLCEAVTGNAAARALLDTLEHDNLFLVPLDDERGWYRYHQLFADLLRVMLDNSYPGLAAELHRRASGWLAAQGLIPEALRHALAAGEMELAARLVSSNVLALVDHAELAPVLMQMDAAPRKPESPLPWLDVAHAWALAYSGQMERVNTALLNAEKQLDSLSEPERSPITGHIAAVRAYAAWVDGRQGESVAYAENAARLLPADEIAARALNLVTLGNALNQYERDPQSVEVLEQAISLARQAKQYHVFMLAASALAYACLQLGRLQKAHAVCLEAISAAEAYQREAGQPLFTAASIYPMLSSVLLEWGENEHAIRTANKGLALAERWGQADTIELNLLNLINALSVSRDFEGAQQAVQRVRRLAEKVSVWFVLNVDELETRMWLDSGNIPAAARTVHEAQGELSAGLQARLLLMQGRPREAFSLVEHNPGYPIISGIFQSLALFAEKNEAGALAVLKDILALAEPENHVLSFVRIGEPMEKLLRLALKKSICPNFVRHLLAAFKAQHNPKPAPVTETLIEPLSERELEVLSLLDGPLSTPEIAEKLFVTSNTVRTHIKNIYGKLNVHGRSGAVRRAQELGLVK